MTEWNVFNGNALAFKTKTKKEALDWVGLFGPHWSFAKVRGPYILRLWDCTGRELEFVSHGGGHGEWR